MAEITLTEAQNGGTFTVRLGDAIVITLSENPSAGYRWSADSDETVLALDGHDYSPGGRSRQRRHRRVAAPRQEKDERDSPSRRCVVGSEQRAVSAVRGVARNQELISAYFTRTQSTSANAPDVDPAGRVATNPNLAPIHRPSRSAVRSPIGRNVAPASRL